MKSNTRWNNVILLSISQALFQTSSFIGSTLSVLVGLQLAPNESLATLPVSVGSLGTALMMIPASLIIRKIGQRKGFMLGTLFGVLAGLLCFYGILFKSFSIFVVGTMLVGCYQGFSQYYRFAAADTVQETNKGKAISFVMAAGVVAAIIGPNLAKYTQHLGNTTFAYSFLSITLLSILALIVTSLLKLTHERTTHSVVDSEPARPLKIIIQKKHTVNALISSAVGYSVMVMVMTATPIAMHHCGHSSSSSATVIQWHLLGMFVPSFFTGILIKKIGVYNVILIGILVLCLHVVIALTGTDFMHFISGLIFLGVGWNFMYIGGSTLLTHVYYPAEKEKTQAFHDFLVFAVITGSSFLAGTLLKYWGWHGVNLAIIPLLLLALIKILIARTKKMAQ
ncbi:MAG: MFS transporter permease [Candidatus Fluviicola riflensis]|nr:MAG: MFS transporter [Candidatus Fluviicola riflensis]OGS77814.1 MAG: MFS transporter permease [Candidatus Fluviicola riflensis]OGS84879.1 MAG: MFS transporter permease [Fluviicola sp. RIFCSPHIGHO2_01_FULL_43_53]OGS89151.1 MAG: MFS transporter permease [Fluviicola sp. RIFCSPHIGHO2_12_FULL_43_24]